MLGGLNSRLAVQIAEKEARRAGKTRGSHHDSSTHDDSTHASPSDHDLSSSIRSKQPWPAQRHSSSIRSSKNRGSSGSIRLGTPGTPGTPNKPKVKKPAPRLSANAPKNLSREELSMLQESYDSVPHGVPGNIVCGGSMSGGDSATSALEHKAEKLLEAMNAALDTLVDQEVELSATLTVQNDRARARYDSGNTVGAAISIKKAMKSQAELKRLVLVIDYLESQKEELSTQLNEFKTVQELEAAVENSRESFSAVTTDPLNLSAFTNFAAEVQARLEESIEEENRTDEEILKEYKSMLGSA